MKSICPIFSLFFPTHINLNEFLFIILISFLFLFLCFLSWWPKSKSLVESHCFLGCFIILGCLLCCWIKFSSRCRNNFDFKLLMATSANFTQCCCLTLIFTFSITLFLSLCLFIFLLLPLTFLNFITSLHIKLSYPTNLNSFPWNVICKKLRKHVFLSSN